QLLSSENPSFIAPPATRPASRRPRRNLGAPRLHGRPQRRELLHPADRASENRLDLPALVRSQIELAAGVVRVDLVRRPSTDQRGADGGIAEPPRQRDLAQRPPARLGDLLAEAIDHADVGLEVLAPEDRLAERHAAAAPVAGGLTEVGRRGEGSREQAVAE